MLVGAGLLAAGIGFTVVTLWPSRASVVRVLADRPPDLSRFDAQVSAAARESGVDPALLRALAAAESGGDPRAKSRAGAVGLMQLMPATAAEQARRLGLDPDRVDLEDPGDNLRLGAAYLARLLSQFDQDERFALAAYNAGPESVRRWRLRAADAPSEEVLRREAYAETRTHGARVLRFRDSYRAR